MENLFENIGNPEALATVNDAGITASVLNVPVMRKGEVTYIRVSNSALVEAGVSVYQLATAEDKAVMATAIILARLDREAVLKAGFKSIAEYAHGIVPKLTDNVINTRRRVGLMFGDLESDGYHWRAMVGDEVSVSNLEIVVKHFFKTADGKPIDFEKLTAEERTKMYADFMLEYVQSGKIDLHSTQSKLRESIADIEKTVTDATFEEIPEGQQDGQQDGQQAPTETAETRYDSALEHIKALKVLFDGNKTALKALESLVKALDTLK